MQPLQERYLETVRRTQWLPPDQLLSYQARLLEHIARHAYETVPFYRNRLAPLFRHGHFEPRAWRDVPILSRSQVLANIDDVRALSVPVGAARDSEGRTSGTLGAPLQFVQSEIAGIASLCLLERMFETHSVDKTAHLARIRLTAPGSADYPEGVEERGWSLTHSQSRYSRLGIHSSIAEQAEWLERRAPAYLATYPSTAAALARHLEERAGKIPLRAVITAGETVDDDTRDDVRRAFGCEIIDRYATEEIGHIASQCPAGGGYHVCIEAILLELVDRDGNDVAPGERGRVVLTSLYNFAMPFIRYDIGDLAVAAEGPCRCGSSLPRLEAILGRQRSVFTFPDGSQYSPWKWRAIFRPHIHAVQIQLVQTEADRIEVRYVPRKGASLPDADLIERLGRSAIHPNVIVKAVTVEEIPRHPSGKMPDCISLVTPA